MEREHILNCLASHILENYEGPFTYQRKWKNRGYFAQESYSKWAANEFLDYVTNRRDIFLAADNYIRMVDNFACSNHENRWMFSIAYDVAVDLLDFMNAVK